MAFKESFRVFRFHRNLWYGIVVHTESHAVFPGIFIFRLVFCRDIRVVIFVSAEQIQFLVVFAQLAYLREHVVSGFYSYGYCVFPDGCLFVRGVVRCKVSLYLADGRGVAQIAVVGVSAHNPVVPVEREVYRSYGYAPFCAVVGLFVSIGVFAFKLGYVLNRAHELIDFVDYDDLFDKYETLTKISFDYAVVEHEPEIEVIRFSGTWADLGTWNTLTEALDSRAIGKAIFDDTCENVHVVNELNVPILCMGLKNMVVSASPEGILVSDKEQSSNIKPYVSALDNQIKFAEKSWGSFRVLDVQDGSMIVKVTLNPGQRMNYHSHQFRNEVWTVIAGEGRTIVDGMEQKIRVGDVITMAAGCRHTVIAETELQLIEIQLGKEISVHDNQKYELEQ